MAARATAMHSAGIASIAARVDFGDDQDSGVARSSRAGTKRSVNARPTSRFCPARSGCVPRSHTLRSPFFSRMVVMVAVVTFDSVSTISASVGMGFSGCCPPFLPRRAVGPSPQPGSAITASICASSWRWL